MLNSNCLNNIEPQSPERHKENEKKKKKEWGKDALGHRTKKLTKYIKVKMKCVCVGGDYNTRKQNPTIIHSNGLKKPWIVVIRAKL